MNYIFGIVLKTFELHLKPNRIPTKRFTVGLKARNNSYKTHFVNKMILRDNKPPNENNPPKSKTIYITTDYLGIASEKKTKPSKSSDTTWRTKSKLNQFKPKIYRSSH